MCIPTPHNAAKKRHSKESSDAGRSPACKISCRTIIWRIRCVLIQSGICLGIREPIKENVYQSWERAWECPRHLYL